MSKKVVALVGRKQTATQQKKNNKNHIYRSILYFFFMFRKKIPLQKSSRSGAYMSWNNISAWRPNSYS